MITFTLSVQSPVTKEIFTFDTLELTRPSYAEVISYFEYELGFTPEDSDVHVNKVNKKFYNVVVEVTQGQLDTIKQQFLD